MGELAVKGTNRATATQYDTNPSGLTHSDGQLYYDTTWKTLAVDLNTDISLQIGQEDHILVWNATGAQIDNGKAVYINGTSTIYPTVALAQANNYSTAFVLGLATQNIPTGGTGYVCVRGNINDVNTNAWTAGDELFLSDVTPGELVNAEPAAPAYSIRVGRVIVKDPSVGKIYVRQRVATRLTDIADVTITTPVVNDGLRYNGTEWVNAQIVAPISGGPAVQFYPAATAIIAKSAENAFAVETLSKTPSASAEKVEAIPCVSNTVNTSAYLYNSALGRTTLDAGTWAFSFYCSVSSVAAGRVSTITQNVYRVRPETVTTVTVTGGPGTTSRTVNASGGTPFASADIDASATNTVASYLQTPKGLFQITARASDTQVTILVPAAYVNETTVAFSVWKKLTGGNSPTITSLTTNYTLQTTNVVSAAHTLVATDKLGMIPFGTSNNTTTVNYVYQGTTHYSTFSAPVPVLHDNLPGIAGSGTSHLSVAEQTWVSSLEGATEIYVDVNQTLAPTGTTTVTGLRCYTDITGGGSSGQICGLVGASYYSGTTKHDTIYGCRYVATNSNTGGLSNLIALWCQINSTNASGTADVGINIHIPSPSTTGYITTKYGLKIDAQKTSNVTTAYGIYQTGASDLNYLQGWVGVGVVPAQLGLDVNSTIRARAIPSAYTITATLTLGANGVFQQGNASDIRLKDNIQPVESVLNKVLALNVKRFTWRATPDAPSNVGLIAQQIEDIFPDVVTTNEVDGLKGIEYSRFVPYIIKAIQELKELI